MSKGVFARSWRGYFASSYLGEDGGPDGLDAFDASSLDQGLELVGLLHSKSAVYSGESTTKNGHIQCVFLGSPAQMIPITVPFVFFCSLVSYSLASIESQTAPAISHMWSFCLVARRRVEWETYGDLNAIVGEDQGRVGGGELSSRHCV